LLSLGMRKTVTPAKAGVQRPLAFPSIIHSRKGRPPRLPWLSGSKLGSAARLSTSFSCNLLCAPSNIFMPITVCSFLPPYQPMGRAATGLRRTGSTRRLTLTPALSQRERGKVSSRAGERVNGRANEDHSTCQRKIPSPPGRGQGEGRRRPIAPTTPASPRALEEA
jgi:hypothetical protein